MSKHGNARWLVPTVVAALSAAGCQGDEGPVGRGESTPAGVTLETEVLGPFVGAQAKLHPENLGPPPVRFYGTDLGFTYQHGDTLHILFGDTMATEEGDPIEASTGRDYEDSFGTIDLAEWSRPETFSSDNMPLVRIGQNPGGAEAAAIDPGQLMEGFKTPVGGFSNGRREFGLFWLGKPVACHGDGDCDNGQLCDTGLGFVGDAPQTGKGLTLACVDGSSQACSSATIPPEGGDDRASGLCVDPTSSIAADSAIGRVASTAMKLRVGIRDTSDPSLYRPLRDWATNKFLNVAARTVQDFDPVGPSERTMDFRPAGAEGANRRVFLWGRPAFVGVNATGRSASLYFAYVDLPDDDDTSWQLHYFAGVDANSIPEFSPVEADAVALDLDATTAGIQAAEVVDVVNQHSVAWIEPLDRWVMLYGGGVTNLPVEPYLPRCGVLELFAGDECGLVHIGDGAFRLRIAEHPWGPWSPPVDVIAGGDPAVAGAGQYGVGGMLRHPECRQAGCAPHTRARDINPREYGFFYSANIIEQWTRPAAGGAADIIWNASTWDPYRVILLRTRIRP